MRVRVECQFLLSQSLWHLITGGSSYEWSEEVTHPMCGLSHHIGSQGLFTYIQPWPASTMLCLCSRSQKTCQTEHFYYSGMFHLPPSTGCCSGLVCHLSELCFNTQEPNQAGGYPTCLRFGCSLCFSQWLYITASACVNMSIQPWTAHMQKQAHGDLSLCCWLCLLVFSQYLMVYSVNLQGQMWVFCHLC